MEKIYVYDHTYIPKLFNIIVKDSQYILFDKERNNPFHLPVLNIMSDLINELSYLAQDFIIADDWIKEFLNDWLRIELHLFVSFNKSTKNYRI